MKEAHNEVANSTALPQDLDFGSALKWLKAGSCVARSGWNGKGMHLYLENHLGGTIQAGAYKGHKREYAPVICMFTAQGIHQPGWLASQADMLANDWCVVNPR